MIWLTCVSGVAPPRIAARPGSRVCRVSRRPDDLAHACVGCRAGRMIWLTCESLGMEDGLVDQAGDQQDCAENADRDHSDEGDRRQSRNADDCSYPEVQGRQLLAPLLQIQLQATEGLCGAGREPGFHEVEAMLRALGATLQEVVQQPGALKGITIKLIAEPKDPPANPMAQQGTG